MPESAVKRMFEAIARIVSDREGVEVKLVEIKKKKKPQQDEAA